MSLIIWLKNIHKVISEPAFTHPQGILSHPTTTTNEDIFQSKLLIQRIFLDQTITICSISHNLTKFLPFRILNKFKKLHLLYKLSASSSETSPPNNTLPIPLESCKPQKKNKNDKINPQHLALRRNNGKKNT